MISADNKCDGMCPRLFCYTQTLTREAGQALRVGFNAHSSRRFEVRKATGVAVFAALMLLGALIGAASALTVASPSAASTNYSVNAIADYTLSTMRMGNEQISNTTTSTVITFPSNFDLRGITGVSIPSVSNSGSFSVSGQTLSIRWVSTIKKNRTLRITIKGLRNASQPGTGAAYSIVGTITTSASATKITWPLDAPLTANATAVTSIVSVVDTSAVSTASTYTVGFNLGPQGRLAGTTAAGGNKIVITFPVDTTVPATPLASNATINGVSASAVSVSGRVVTLTMPAGSTIAGGQAVTVVFKKAFGLVNPTVASDTYQVSVSTSAETNTGLSAPYTIGVVELTKVGLSSSNQPTTGFVAPGQKEVVDGFSLQRTQGSNPATVSAVTLSNVGTAPSATIAGVSVYLDDGDGEYGASDTLLNTTAAYFSGSTVLVTFDPALQQVISDSLPHQYWVVYAFDLSVLDGQTASSEVTTYSTTAPLSGISASAGAKFTVDGTPPTVTWTDPFTDSQSILDPGSTLLGGTASDSGAGIAWTELQIRREDDGQWWDGTGWASSATTLTAWGMNWTYDWTLLPALQNGTPPYSLFATPVDRADNRGATVVLTNIRVDNMPPTVVSAVAIDATHVDVTFSESLEPTDSVTLRSSFTFDKGLSPTAATLDAGGKIVHLTTNAQSVGVNYTVTAELDVLTDLAGNGIDVPNKAIFLSGAIPSVAVAQGSDIGRPSAEYYATHDATAVADEILLSASGGSAKVSTITVRGLDTAATLRTDIASVTLFRDNGDHLFGPGDAIVGASGVFSADISGTALTFASVNSTVTPGSPAAFWIVYKIGPTPVNGHELGSRVLNGDVQIISATVPAFVTITSANSGKTIAIDTVAPSVPATVRANAVATTSAEITWTVSSDAQSSVSRYNVYRDGTLIAASVPATYTATGLTPGQTYTFSVSAVDGAGNESAQRSATAVTMPSNSIWVTITAPGAGQTLDLGTIVPNAVSTFASGTTVAVGGVGSNQYNLSVNAYDFNNTAGPALPKMVVSVMKYATRGWVTSGATAFSTAPALVSTSAGTKYTWQQTYIFDYSINAPYTVDPGDYSTTVTFTVVQN